MDLTQEKDTEESEEELEEESEEESEEEQEEESEEQQQEPCPRENAHNSKHVRFDVFAEKDYYKTMQHTRNIEEEDRKELHRFLTLMADLTGLLLLKTKTQPYSGTGFISKIRRQYDKQCPCPSEKHGEGLYAIVTISTAYHIFNSSNEKDIKSYDRCLEIWEDSCVEFKLDYNIGEDSSDESVIMEQIKDLPTLYGHQLVESDKDLDFECDWCAIECVTHDPILIECLEKTLKDYQTLMANLYKKSQSSARYKEVNLVVIIGHPHTWPKKISFGQSQSFDDVPKKRILKELRSQQIWCRYSYDNITCFGSSGSPVFIWGQPITGFGYWFGHPHNHASETKKILYSDYVYLGLSTIGVEHVH